MRLVVDSHTHTIASGHSYSTVIELAAEAYNNGVEMFAVTDHGPFITGAPTLLHFWNLKVIPSEINSVKVLKGAETNIINYLGNCDIPDELLDKLDFVIASYHDIVITPATKEEHTCALERVLANPSIDAIAHPGNPAFEVDIDRVVKAAAKYNKLIEINNSSFKVRRGSYENCLEFAEKCKQYGARITCGSDAHISFDVGKMTKVTEILEAAAVPEELVICSSRDKFEAYLKERKTRIKDKP